ncbi:hypothetical protein C4552_04140 [Candidatus Parcubacteria bacterium]|nr:MAG: hypothetical protein C4552_04140 [Candidatus Parcubacteria bacterium]
MKKKLALGIVVAGTAVALLPLFAAFEAHVVNVTAKIENALSVGTEWIDFGTVFPQEHLDQPLTVQLSNSFLEEGRVDDVAYFIRQKPKCAITAENGTVLMDEPLATTGHLVANQDGSYSVDCGEAPRQLTTGETWGVLPSLCEYISKHGPDENDGNTNSFHIPFWVDTNGPTSTVQYLDTFGRLAKSDVDTEDELPGDTVDNWVIDLAVPCFGNYCAQDWQEFVERVSASSTIDADAFTQPIANEHKIFGCDLWVEVSDVSEEVRPLVGAAVASYDDPADCTDTVSGSESLQAAIDAAAPGATICVDSTYNGTDTFPINVDESVTIAGLGAAGDANIPGGMFIDADNVTITGLEFTNYSFIQASANAAIYIHNETGQGSNSSLDNTVISHNLFTAPGGAKGADAKAVITEIGSGSTPVATNIDILHNVFDGWRQAMFFNTASNYEVAFNDILNNDVGVANDGPDASSIHHNDFESNVLEAVGVAPAAANGTSNNGVLTVNTNNFAPAGLGNNVNWYGPSVSGGADVNAEDNWWDGEAEAARTNDITEVDTEPAESSAYPEN